MNFTESFQEFSSRLGPKDLALYAGVGLVLWVLFKDRLSPVQQLIVSVVDKAKSLLGQTTPSLPAVIKPISNAPASSKDEDVFFRLVVSWKQTRDLAVQSGCSEAVKVADQMFPFLSPNVCKKEENVA